MSPAMWEALRAYDRAIARGLPPSMAIHFIAAYCQRSWAVACEVLP